MSTGREFSGHHKPGHYETRIECTPRASGDPYPVKNTKEMDSDD